MTSTNCPGRLGPERVPFGGQMRDVKKDRGGPGCPRHRQRPPCRRAPSPAPVLHPAGKGFFGEECHYAGSIHRRLGRASLATKTSGQPSPSKSATATPGRAPRRRRRGLGFIRNVTGAGGATSRRRGPMFRNSLADGSGEYLATIVPVPRLGVRQGAASGHSPVVRDKSRAGPSRS